jgi:hypothetical protein
MRAPFPAWPPTRKPPFIILGKGGEERGVFHGVTDVWRFLGQQATASFEVVEP